MSYRKKKCNVSHKELREMAKELAELDEECNDLNQKRMEHGLEESDNEEFEGYKGKAQQIREKIEECTDNPEGYYEMGRNDLEDEREIEEAIEEEENEEEEEDEEEED